VLDHRVRRYRFQEERRRQGEGRQIAATIETTKIAFAEEDLADLRRRLASARFPESSPEPGWTSGIDLAWLRGLLAYWKDGFDWRAVEARLNAWPHRFVEAGPLRVHALEARSRHADALPLLMIHGWPGSVLEFLDVLGPLTDPVAHGGDARDAFHVIAPSIPGYGLSEAPREEGFDIKAVGETMAAVMHALGYERYGVQGGDWGAIAAPYAAVFDPRACIGIHLNMVLVPRPPGGGPELTPREKAAIDAARLYMQTGTAYQRVQGLEPGLIGIALDDSPAALCAWIVSKMRAWSDCGGDVESRFTRDEILANVTWYWLTRSAASSVRLYHESIKSGRFRGNDSRVETPTGCAIFPREIFCPPRSWVERIYNVTRWTEMKSGGHFAAMEEPQALVDDVRAFFRPLRQS
jgi:microsomal epoxide hydrolase